MSETSIGWTAVQDGQGRWHSGFTFNPWQGCSKVSKGCANCYAEGIDVRFWGGTHWGAHAERAVQTDEYWAAPLAWNRRAKKLGLRLRVFCGSVCDWLEDREDLAPLRERLRELIDATPNLDWLMLTKRPENLLKLTPWRTMAPGNVWLGVSAENQETYDLRVPRIKELGAAVHFVSGEPLLGPLSTRQYSIDWLIVGSERGPGARRPDHAWLDEVLLEARKLRLPVFLKQWQQDLSRAGQVIDLPMWNGRQYLQQPRAAGWQPRAESLRGCAAKRCPDKVPLRMLMCAKHWRMVPRALRAKIWRHYKPGQETNGGATAEYFAAVHEAIDLVGAREIGVPHSSGQLALPLIAAEGRKA